LKYPFRYNWKVLSLLAAAVAAAAAVAGLIV